MESWIEIHQPTDERLRPMYVYVIDGSEVSPYFFSRTVCEAFGNKYEELSEKLTLAKARLRELENEGCKRGIIFYGQYYIPSIEDEIHRFFQDVGNGVFEKKVLHQNQKLKQ